MVSIVLRVNHFEVVEAASAAAALKEFEASEFELAIVDIFLQGTDGFEIIMKMRERIPDHRRDHSLIRPSPDRQQGKNGL
jgi:DNA-binding response OmpR family regulator